jgi:hypothetical protein
MTQPRYWSLSSYPLSSTGSPKVVCGGITDIGWGNIMDEPHFVEYPMGQYPITLTKYAPKNVGNQCH